MSEQQLMLRKDILMLFKFMQRIKEELAAVRQPTGETDHFQSMSDELDAIVGATESATNTILEGAEKIDEAAVKISELVGGPEVEQQIATINGQVGQMFEACSFQDITGQRVGKVVRSLKFIDERVTAMVDLWGESELAQVEIALEEDQGEEAGLLNGPQLDGEGVSQAEVDQLFTQDDIDKLFD